MDVPARESKNKQAKRASFLPPCPLYRLQQKVQPKIKVDLPTSKDGLKVSLSTQGSLGAHLFSKHLEGRNRRISVSIRPVWSTEEVPARDIIQRNSVSKERKRKKSGSSYFK